MAPMHLPMERILWVRCGVRVNDPERQIPECRIFVEAAWTRKEARVRQGIAGARVMLHLRDCHASKAAILTIPAFHVPVENRSPA